jgi:hypothetical protein
MGMVRDTWRAVLVLVVGVLLLEAGGLRRQGPTPSVETRAMPGQAGYHPPVETRMMPGYAGYSPPVIVNLPQPQPDRPLRRVGEAVVALGDSVIGVFRR